MTLVFQNYASLIDKSWLLFKQCADFVACLHVSISVALTSTSSRRPK